MPHNVEKDFLDAYYRLEAKAPRHPLLRGRLARGKLRTNANTVALEAGHSRTLIAMKTPGYDRIRKLLDPDFVSTDTRSNEK